MPEDGHMSLGRTGAGGQKRVGLRSSMSRLVLLAARESRDTELEMADGGRTAADRSVWCDLWRWGGSLCLRGRWWVALWPDDFVLVMDFVLQAVNVLCIC